MAAPAMIGALMSSLGGLKSGVQQAVGAFQQLNAQLAGFVEALSPSAVLVMNQAMRDLTAVIGSAVLPVFNVLTSTVKGVSSILLPAFEALRPTIDRVAAALSSLVGSGLDNLELLMQPVGELITLFADLLDALKPVLKMGQAFAGLQIQLIATVVSALAGLLGVAVTALQPLFGILGALRPALQALQVILAGVAAVFRSVLAALAGMLGGAGGNLVNDFAAAMKELAKWAVVAAVALSRFLGIKSFEEGVRNALSLKRKDATGFAAPQDAKIGSDILAFSRQVAELAALATGAGTTKTDEEKWRDDILAAVNALKGDGGLQAMLNNAAEVMAQQLFIRLTGRAFEAAGAGAADAPAIVDLSLPGGFARALARRLFGR